MKVLVYQSFRTQDVPPWVGTCMDSVRAWASQRAYGYQFIDDALFDHAPAWYREKVGHEVHLVSDLARLVLARQFLAQGWERVVWIDADVLVFDPDSFHLPLDTDYAFCREVWLRPVDANRMGLAHNVNNAVALFAAGNPLLDFYIHACEEIVRHHPAPPPAAVGTEFLTRLNRQFPIDRIRDVGLFSPFVTRALLLGDTALLQHYMQAFGHPVHAANLCTTYIDKPYFGVTLSNQDFGSVVAMLLNSRGAVLNRLLQGG